MRKEIVIVQRARLPQRAVPGANEVGGRFVFLNACPFRE
jgi:hypothetical protein